VAVVGATLTGLVIARSLGSVGDGWVRVGALEELRSREVVFLPRLDAYMVTDAHGTPVTLVARSTQMGEPVVYCPTSMWFEDSAHGSKFDRLGRYALGPAPRGLDRLITVVHDGVVWVDPSRELLGPPREDAAQIPPAGPFCVSGDEG
jgi:hypothetical protein